MARDTKALLTDLYTKYNLGAEKITDDVVSTVDNTYGEDTESLLKDLYTKYNLGAEKITPEVVLNVDNTYKKKEETEVSPSQSLELPSTLESSTTKVEQKVFEEPQLAEGVATGKDTQKTLDILEFDKGIEKMSPKQKELFGRVRTKLGEEGLKTPQEHIYLYQKGIEAGKQPVEAALYADLTPVTKDGEISYEIPIESTSKFQKEAEFEYKKMLQEKKSDTPFMKQLNDQLIAGAGDFVSQTMDVLGFAGLNLIEGYDELTQKQYDAVENIASNMPQEQESIIEMAQSGDIGGASGKAALSLARTLPSMITMMAGGQTGLMNMSAGVARAKYRELKDSDVPELMKVVSSISDGVAEFVFEGAVTLPMLNKARSSFIKLGREEAESQLKPVFASELERVVSGVWGATNPAIKEGASEAATQIIQNMGDVAYLGQDKDIMEGVSDAFVVGALIGKGITGPVDIANLSGYLKGKVKKIPEGVSMSKKYVVTPLLVKKDQILKNKEKADDAFAPQFKEEINSVDEEIRNEVEKPEVEITGEEFVDSGIDTELDALIKEEEKASRKELEAKKNEELAAKRTPKVEPTISGTSKTLAIDHVGETAIDKDGREGVIIKAPNGQLLFETEDRIVELGSAGEAQTSVMEDYGINLKTDLPARDISIKGKPTIDETKEVSNEELQQKTEQELKDIESYEQEFVDEYEKERLSKAEKQTKELEYMTINHNGNDYLVRKKKDGSYAIMNDQMKSERSKEIRSAVEAKYETERTKEEEKILTEAVSDIEQVKKESSDRVLDALNWLVDITELKRDKLYSNPLAIPQSMLNASFKIVRTTYIGTKNLANAINEGIKYLESRGQNVDRVKYIKHFKEQVNAQKITPMREQGSEIGKEQEQQLRNMPSEPQQKEEVSKEKISVGKKYSESKNRKERSKIISSEIGNVKFEEGDKYESKIDKIKSHLEENGIELSKAEIKRQYAKSKKLKIDDAFRKISKGEKGDYKKVVVDFLKDNTDPDVISIINNRDYNSLISKATRENSTERQVIEAIKVIDYIVNKSESKSIKEDLNNISKGKYTTRSARGQKKGKLSTEQTNTITSYQAWRKKSISDIEAALNNEPDFDKAYGMELALKEKAIDGIEAPSPNDVGYGIASEVEVGKSDAYDSIYEELYNIINEGKSELKEKKKEQKLNSDAIVSMFSVAATKGKIRGAGGIISDFIVDAYEGRIEDGVNKLISTIKENENFKTLSEAKQESIIRNINSAKKIPIEKAIKKIESSVSTREYITQESKKADIERSNIRKWWNNSGLVFESFDGLINSVVHGTKQELQNVIKETSGKITKSRRNFENIYGKFTDMVNEQHAKLKDKIKNYEKEFWTPQKKYGIPSITLTQKDGSKRVYTGLEKMSLSQVLKRYVELKNEKIRDMYIKNNGMSEQTLEKFEKHINEIVESNPLLMDYANWQVNELYPKLYEAVNPTYRELNDIDMPIEMLYSPIEVIKDNGKDIDILPNAETLSSRSGTVAHGNAIARVAHRNPINLETGIDETLVKYMDNMLYYASFAPAVRDISKILNSPIVTNAIKSNSGIEALKLLKEHLDDIANNGKKKERKVAESKILAAKNRFVMSVLGANPRILATQLTSAPAYAASTNTGKYLYRFLDPKTWTHIAPELMNSPFIKARYRKGFTRDMAAGLEREAKHVVDGKKTILDYMMSLIKTGDVGAIIIGGAPYYAVKKSEYIKQGMTEEEAKSKAYDDFANTTEKQQQSAYTENLASIQRSTATNLLTSFMSTPIQYQQQVRGAIRNIRRGRGSINDIKKIMMFSMTMPMMYNLVRAILSNDDDDDKYKKAFKRSFTDGMLQGTMADIYGIKEGTAALVTDDRMREQNSIKSFSILDRTLGTSYRAINTLSAPSKSEKEKEVAVIDATALTISVLTGMPVQNLTSIITPIVYGTEDSAWDIAFGGAKADTKERKNTNKYR